MHVEAIGRIVDASTLNCLATRSTPDTPAGLWQIWIDTGGTFTDCIALSPEGNAHRLKILSSGVLRGRAIRQPDHVTVQLNITWPVERDIFSGFQLRVVGTGYHARVISVDLLTSTVHLDKPIPGIAGGSFIELASDEEVPVLAARFLTHTPLNRSFPDLEVRLGSTRGTNAILEKKGATTALLVTKGFKDLLVIGNQQRPDLFALHVKKIPPLYDSVREVDERIAADGSILSGIDAAGLEEVTKRLKKGGTQSIAVALLNAYANPVHEEAVAKAVRRAGFEFVSVSHELSSQIRLLPRAETTVANAYLDPIIHHYVSGIRRGLSTGRLWIMTSSGSLVRADSFFPKDSLLSGPAGGVVGAAHQARRSGIDRILAFDMGGTSTDVSMYNRRYDYRFESHVGSYSILSPSLAIETIAAGGGSICAFDGHRLTVGPQSAGANPGPACYGAGGPLTITDVNLLLGRIDPQQFSIPLQPEAAEKAFSRLLAKMKRRKRPALNPIEILESLLQIANEKMAEAIRKISVKQGHDPKEFVLLSFGGAGGQHACALAEILEMDRVLVPYDAGLLSAYGIGHAAIERFGEKLVLEPWTTYGSRLDRDLDGLFRKAQVQLEQEGHPRNLIRRKSQLLYLRFVGQDSSVEIDYQTGQSVLDLFRNRYEAIYGHWTGRVVEVESIRVIAVVGEDSAVSSEDSVRSYTPTPLRTGSAILGGKKRSCPIFRWENLNPGSTIHGPALVVSGNSTTLINDGWSWFLDKEDNAILTRKRKGAGSGRRHAQAAELELFTNRFTAIAQQMGALLQRTSFSVNIKERLDYSCALLDAGGYLVVNAPHIPVHLGSMGVCVREVCRQIRMEDGDVIITNHPAYGGSHLPDVTLIKPVFYKKKLVGFVANRAHHAEIGGTKPGSTPADARTLEEEGVIIAPAYLVRQGKSRWDELRELLTTARFPSRTPRENLADIHGALASVNLGEHELKMLCAQFGPSSIAEQMKALSAYAASLLSDRIRRLPKRTFSATEYLDDRSRLHAGIRRVGKNLVMDFTGSSTVHPGNLNATKAIVQSLVLYCLRLLIDRPLPMNEGLMEHVRLVLPTGLLNPDFTGPSLPAVVGGNTEVSQRLTDTILKAFGLAACSQGTMNNFLFGNERFGYYETICGGTGAGRGFDGTDAVHQHMTNTRITDPEILEFRYPARIIRFEVRTRSGGQGKWSGGNGVIREVEFLEDLDVNLLTQHRAEMPYGMRGGAPGKVGTHVLIRKASGKQSLPGIVSIQVSSGDRLVIQTPGGGGFGTRGRTNQRARK